MNDKVFLCFVAVMVLKLDEIHYIEHSEEFSEFSRDLVNIFRDFYQGFYHLFTTGFYGGSQIKALINDNFLIKTVQAGIKILKFSLQIFSS